VAVEAGAAKKTYLALVSGVVRADAGTIDVPLRVTDEPMGNRPKTVPDAAHGLPAITRYRVARRFSDASLLEVTIETGRTHQIRAHLRHLGHPIWGDPRYGEPERNDRLRETFGIDRPLLHASRLTIPHPMTAAPLTAEAKLPADLSRLLRALR
jgi:23S rRNA-/tRNA-specific pseudouridylate synthase